MHAFLQLLRDLRDGDAIEEGRRAVAEVEEAVVTPFEGAAAAALTARLRFGKPDEKGRVKFQYKLGEAPQQAIDDEFGRMQSRIREETGCPVYWGNFMSPGR